MPTVPAPPLSELTPRPAVGRVFPGGRRVRLGDVSPSGRLRLDAVARFLQDLSGDDTADAALPDAETWVVRKTVIEVHAFPRYLEDLELATWCSGTGSHWAERRISITGAAGGSVEAASTWVHFDHRSGRPKRVSEDFQRIYGEASGGRRIKARLQHPAAPPDAAREPWPLRATDFDVLAHVNNAAYWEAVEEVLARRSGRRGPLRAEMEHHAAVDRSAVASGTTVDLIHRDDRDELDLWLVADSQVAASARVRPLA